VSEPKLRRLAERTSPFLNDATLSSYREQLVEYVFLADLLQDGWLRRGQRIDVLRADVDGAGYDLVAECQGVIRQIQMKSTVAGGAARGQKLHMDLAQHRSGCVVWALLDELRGDRLVMTFLVLGGPPGDPMPPLDGYRMARHAKANAQGVKTFRRATREVPRSAFTPLPDIASLSDWLFGSPRGEAR
jgi:hypothetical protein